MDAVLCRHCLHQNFEIKKRRILYKYRHLCERLLKALKEVDLTMPSWISLGLALFQVLYSEEMDLSSLTLTNNQSDNKANARDISRPMRI